MFNDDNYVDLDGVDSDGFSLESILAEFKGEAFLSGDKKTPTELLDREAQRIIREATEGFEAEKNESAADEPVPAQSSKIIYFNTAAETVSIPYPVAETAEPTPPEPAIAPREEQVWENPFTGEMEYTAAGRAAKLKAEKKDGDTLFSEKSQTQESESDDSIVADVEKAIERELGNVEPPEVTGKKIFTLFESPLTGDGAFDDREDEAPAEPDLSDAAKKYAEACSSISLRLIPAALITVIMVMLTFAFEAELIIPFGIGYSRFHAIGALMAALLIVMILCADIILRGVMDLARGAPNVETLVLFSCAFSLISGAFTIFRGSPEVMTYCAVSALSLTFAAFGEKLNLRAIADTLKTSVISSEPYGVLADYNNEIDKSVLKKTFDRKDGFFNNLIHPDITESAFRYAAPVLLAAALLLSIVTAFLRSQAEYFLHIISALLAGAAPFSAMLAFSLPYITVTKSLKKSGAALAGWGGADEICNTDGACVTDNDLFPPGTLAFNGVKMYEGVHPEKAIRYTASLIIASRSGLSRIFSEALKSLGLDVINVLDFACHEGGVGALIGGERVMTGSAAFMNLLGIRVPDDMNMKNAVYTALNNKLVAMFVVDYEPVNSVQSALISILKWRIKLFFAMRDFNITPLMLEQKFKVSLEDVEYIQTRDSYTISDVNIGKEGHISAILTREGLGPFAEAVTGGRLLRAAALAATAVSILSASFAVIILFYISWTGAFFSARPGNLIVFMLSMLAVVLLICGYAKCKK